MAIGEIGHIKNDYLAKVRGRLEKELGIKPEVSWSMPAIVTESRLARTSTNGRFKRSRKAAANAPGSGPGGARQLALRSGSWRTAVSRLKNGKEIDIRHAYSVPLTRIVAQVGTVDPEIRSPSARSPGRARPWRLVYSFACHPIKGASGGLAAGLAGFASRVIEDNLSDGDDRPVALGVWRRHQSRCV